jgi:hypothetical protein
MLDADKQAAINLFVCPFPALVINQAKANQLGVDDPLSQAAVKSERPHYRQWFTPAHLEPKRVEEMAAVNEVYKEYYKPHILSQFARLYAL